MKKKVKPVLRDTALAALILIASTLLGVLFLQWGFHETNVVVVYLFSVLLVSRFTRGYGYGVGASVVSLLLFNWFFTEPYYTLKVNDMTYLVTFAIMMFTSIVTSTLTTKVKQAAADAKAREAESNALYQMTNHLTDAEDMEEIAEIAVVTVSNILGCNTACICFDEKGVPEKTFIQRRADGSLIRRELSGTQELRQRMAQLHVPVDITEEEYRYPVYGKTMILAVLCVPKAIGAEMSESQTRMLHSIIENAALAFERLRSLQEQARSRQEATQERYRGNLLRAICAIAASLLGSALVAFSDSAGGGNHLYGDLLALLAAVAVAAYTLIGRTVRKTVSTTVYTYVVYVVCAAVLILTALLQGQNLLGYGLSAVVVGLLLAVFSTILGHSIFSWCLKYFSPSFVSASKLCEPIVAAVLAGFLFGEIPVILQVAGGLLILGGVLYYSRIESKEE